MIRRRRRSFDVAVHASALADYGKRAALGDWSGLDGGMTVRGCAPLRTELNYGPTPKARLVSDLCDLGRDRGGWVAVGVWRFLYWDYEEEYLDSARAALDASALALVNEVGLLNPYWFMERREVEAYVRQVGVEPSRGNGNTTVPDLVD